MERTLVLVKPDGVEKNIVGAIINRFESAGLKNRSAQDADIIKKAGREALCA